MSHKPKKDHLPQQAETQATENAASRESAIASVAVVVLLILVWTYLVWFSWSMPMGIPGMRVTTAMGKLSEFFIAFAMWSVMMVGMMTPPFIPTIFAYVRLGHHPAKRNQSLAPAGWLLGGYLLVWLCFALIASAAQTAFLGTGLIGPTLGSSSSLFSVAVFILAGLYQLSPFKNACLSHCQVPQDFIHQNGGFSRGRVASLRLGLKNGLYCVGCCWALMSVLFVVGVMQLLWVAILSIFVLFEKIDPLEAGVTRRVSAFFLLGVAMIFLGASA